MVGEVVSIWSRSHFMNHLRNSELLILNRPQIKHQLQPKILSKELYTKSILRWEMQTAFLLLLHRRKTRFFSLFPTSSSSLSNCCMTFQRTRQSDSQKPLLEQPKVKPQNLLHSKKFRSQKKTSKSPRFWLITRSSFRYRPWRLFKRRKNSNNCWLIVPRKISEAFRITW